MRGRTRLSAGHMRVGPDGLAGLRLCRDCLRKDPQGSARCARCGSPRTISLEDAAGLTIAHVDCDAFYAAVEKRDDPSLNDKALIVGGAGPRGVVATCCYIARTFGVRSAMPMSRARALCPNAVVLPPDMAKYARVGREIRARMMALTPLVEPLSIDEAFLDLSGCEPSNGAGAAETLARFARSIEVEIGVTVSVGLSYCKFLAKIASDLNKPRGFAFLSQEEAKAWLATQSVERLWGIGRVGRERLERSGFRLIGDLQRIEERDALLRLGEDGLRLWRLAQGRDDRAVHAERETKSVSSETTFDRDISDKAELTRILLAQCDRVPRACAGRRWRPAELRSSCAWRTSLSERAAEAASEPRSLRRGCSQRRGLSWTPSATARLSALGRRRKRTCAGGRRGRRRHVRARQRP